MSWRSVSYGVVVIVLSVSAPGEAALITGGGSGAGGGGGGGGSDVSINGVAEPTPNFTDSSDITWTNQGGTVRAWTGLVIDVKKPPYNASCNGTGDDTVAIQAALTNAPNNSTILIDGSEGLCVIDASATQPSLLLENKTGITIQGRRGGGFVMLPGVALYGRTNPYGLGQNLWIIKDSTRITVRGLRFVGDATNGVVRVEANLLALTSCTDCVVEDNEFLRGGDIPGFQLGGAGNVRTIYRRNILRDSNPGTTDNARGISTGNPNAGWDDIDGAILHNTVINSAATAIHYGGVGALIEGNTVSTNNLNGSGFAIGSGGAQSLREFRVVNNLVVNAAYCGIQLYWVTPSTMRTQRMVVANNTVRNVVSTTGCASGIYLYRAHHVTVAQNVLQNSARGILVLGDTHDVTIMGNVITDTRDDIPSRVLSYGIYLFTQDGITEPMRNVTIMGNVMTRALFAGIYVNSLSTGGGITGVQIIGNTSTESGNGLGEAGTGYGLRVAGPGAISQIVVLGNRFANNEVADIRLNTDVPAGAVLVDPASNTYHTTMNVGYYSTLAVNSSAPSVAHAIQWREANTSATTITNLADGREGQTITIWFTTANTTLQHGALIQFANAANFLSQPGDILVLTMANGVWREVSRSRAAAGGGIGGSTGAVDNAVLRADGTGGTTLQSSPCLISDAGVLTCTAFEATASGTGTVSLLAGPAPSAPTTTNEWVFWMTPSGTLTSKTTNDVPLSYLHSATLIPVDTWLDVATCQSGTASLVLDTGSDGPTALCDPVSTNAPKGLAAFNDTTDQAVFFKVSLPSGFTSMDVRVLYKMATAASGTVGWCAEFAAMPPGGSSDPVLPGQTTGTCVASTVPASAGTVGQETIANPTCTNCAAGLTVIGRISRDANGSAVTDSATGDARLIGVRIRIWRTMP